MDGGCEIRFVTLRIWAQGVYKDRQWIDNISEALGYLGVHSLCMTSGKERTVQRLNECGQHVEEFSYQGFMLKVKKVI